MIGLKSPFIIADSNYDLAKKTLQLRYKCKRCFTPNFPTEGREVGNSGVAGQAEGEGRSFTELTPNGYPAAMQFHDMLHDA